MKREVHSGKENLDWTVRRLWVVHRPMSPAQALDEGVDRAVSGYFPGRPGYQNFGNFAVGEMYTLAPVVDTLLSLALLPFLPLVIVLRRWGVVSWTIQARCRPWGRHGPPVVLRWRVKGDAASRRAFDDIVSQLEQGSGAPVIAGAERD